MRLDTRWAFFHGLYDVEKIGFRLGGWETTLFKMRDIKQKLENDYPQYFFHVEDMKGKSKIIWWRRKW